MPEAESMYSQMATILYTTLSKLNFGVPTKIRQPNSQHKQINFLPNNFPHGLFFWVGICFKAGDLLEVERYGDDRNGLKETQEMPAQKRRALPDLSYRRC